MSTSHADSRGRLHRFRRALPGAETRKPSRRLFARHHHQNVHPNPQSLVPTEEDDNRRRSFLAKPPAPGAARRVLTVLNQSQKRSSPFSSRRSPSTRNAVFGSGYELPSDDDPDDIPSDLEEEHRKPDIADVRTTPLVDDVPVTVRSDSAASSMPSSRGTPQRLLDVEASEISDEINSSSDPKSRGRMSPSSTTVTPPQHTDDLVFIDDVTTTAVEFRNVGEEELDVPEAPSEYSKKLRIAHPWPMSEEHYRSLQDEIDALRQEKQSVLSLNNDLEMRNKELEVLLQSLRLRTSESNAEVEELTRQLKDTRKRLTRRVRELEDNLSAQQRKHKDDIAQLRVVERHLRDEIETYADSNAFYRTGSVPSINARRKRASHAGPAPLAQSHADVTIRQLGEPIMSHPSANLSFARVRSAGNVHEQSRRRSTRPDYVSQSSSRSSTPVRKSVAPGSESGKRSPRTVARRSLMRRAFIAHIHSSRYRSSRNAWHDYMAGDSAQITPEQFSRAVRSLAVAADARDRDLEVLREEVCGAEACDTGVVTWLMFMRFYQLTKNEST